MKKTGLKWLGALALLPLCCSSAQAAPVAAKQADSFVGSVGVAGHWGKANVYSTQYPALRDKLVESGIRVMRSNSTNPTVINQIRELGGLGIKTLATIDPIDGTRPNSNYWANPANPTYNIVDYLKYVGVQHFAAVEANNELDLFYSGKYWRNTSEPLNNTPSSPFYYAKYLKASVPDAYNALKADSATAGIPFMGPSLTSIEAYAAVGNLSASVDWSCVHPYMAGRHPETPGWGSNGYGSIAWAKTYLGDVQAPGKPMSCSEGGNSTADPLTVNNQWPLVAHGKYVPRYYFSRYNAGYKLTTMYELVDQGTSSTEPEQNFGLLKADLTPKPAFTALKNLLQTLKDPGSSFTPGSLDYTLSGSTADVQTTLLQKRDGSFFLCYWLAKSCWDVDPKTTITVPAQSVTLSIPATIRNATIYTLDDNGAMSQNAATIANNQISLSVTDRISIIKLGSLAFGGVPRNIPGGRIQAEDYDTGGQGTSFNDTGATNSGGLYRNDGVDITNSLDTDNGYGIIWIAGGEWTQYSIVNTASTGLFGINLRVASPNSGKRCHIEFGLPGAMVDRTGPINIPNTGGWYNWQTITVSNVPIASGPQFMRVVYDTDGFNLNWVEVATDPSGTGVVGWWKLNESSGTVALDSSASNRNGTLTGGTWNPSSGKIGGCLQLSGSSARVALPDDTVRGTGTTLSLSLWFKTSSTGVLIGAQNSAVGGSPSNWNPFLYVDTAGRLRGEFYQNSTATIVSSGTVNNGAWHHVALVSSGNSQTMYLNGAVVGTLSGTVNHYGNNVNQLGAGYTASWPGGNGNWMYFSGSLDDVRLYNRAISASEVSALAGF